VLEAFGILEQATTGNQEVRARASCTLDGAGVDASVHLDVDVEAAFDHTATDGRHLGLHRGDVVLTPEPGVDGHDQHLVDQVQDVVDRLRGSGRVESHRSRGSGVTDNAERAVQVTVGFGVQDDGLTSRVYELRYQPGRLVHHEMGLEGHGDARAHSGDDVGAEREVGYEPAVHDVELNAVHPCLLQGSALLTQPGEVSRQHRRDDLETSIGPRHLRWGLLGHGIDANTLAPMTAPPGPGDPPIELTLQAPVAGGQMLARPEGGPVVLVAGGLPGERVLVRVEKRASNRWEGSVVQVLEPSAHRRLPPCEHVEEGCGGCDLQHAAPEAQPELKRSVVIDALTRLGRVPAPSVRLGVSLPASGYRTTVRGVTGDGGRFAFRARRSHDPVTAGGCLTAHPLIRDLMDVGDFGDASEVTLRVGATTGERMAVVGPNADGVIVPDDVRVVGADELGRGKRAWIHEQIDGIGFRISARSFFQARPDGASALVAEVREMLAGSTPGTLVDACCGVGLISALLSRDGWRVVGIERSRSAIADARINLQGTGARLSNMGVESWRPSKVLGPVDAVVADPPRRGLGRDAARVLAASGAAHLVLVSCDPASLGRDVALLAGHGYVLVDSVLVDLFPHTHHLEVVSHLVHEAIHP